MYYYSIIFHGKISILDLKVAEIIKLLLLYYFIAIKTHIKSSTNGYNWKSSLQKSVAGLTCHVKVNII